MKYWWLIILLVTGTRGITQKTGTGSDPGVNVYEVYKSQFADLMATRGVPEEEIRSMLAKFRDYDINSNEKLAASLGKLYPSDQGIGILCFFLNRDTLRRVLFEPGLIREEKIFVITKQELLQLGNDINHALGLYKSSGARMPVKRGFKLNPPPKTPNTTYDSLIRRASRLLLPERMDTTYRHLLILPVLNIGTIPFAILQPYPDSSFLVDRCSFTIVPGVIDLISLRCRTLRLAVKDWNGDLSADFDRSALSRRMSGTVFTLENPLFVSNPAYPQNTDYHFPDLPGAKKEIDSARMYAEKFTLLEGKKATKEAVLNSMEGADLAYFATHGIADDEKPMENSFLVLAGDDPFLTARNIMDLRNAGSFKRFPEMVILSACQTGLGKPMEAGVAGLARSFLLAGSNHVIMSLWNVDDEATAFLMNRFIYHLQEPGSFMPAEPLRQAMLDTRKEYPSPVQWASFSLFGIDY